MLKNRMAVCAVSTPPFLYWWTLHFTHTRSALSNWESQFHRKLTLWASKAVSLTGCETQEWKSQREHRLKKLWSQSTGCVTQLTGMCSNNFMRPLNNWKLLFTAAVSYTGWSSTEPNKFAEAVVVRTGLSHRPFFFSGVIDGGTNCLGACNSVPWESYGGPWGTSSDRFKKFSLTVRASSSLGPVVCYRRKWRTR